MRSARSRLCCCLLLLSACAGASRRPAPAPSRIDLAFSAPRGEVYQAVLAAFIAEGLNVSEVRPAEGLISARHPSHRDAEGFSYAVTYVATVSPTDTGARVALSANLRQTSPMVRQDIRSTTIGSPSPARVPVTQRNYPAAWERLVRVEQAVHARLGAVKGP